MTTETSPWNDDPCPTCGGYLGIHHDCAPRWLAPLDGETTQEAASRRKANRARADAWNRYMDARCDVCGMVRFHVSHEMDPDTSPEGPKYHSDFAHHQFIRETPA